MTAHEPDVELTVRATITIRLLRLEDLPKIEWHGQFMHFRQMFQRAYREQVQGDRHCLIATMNNYPIGRLFVLRRQKLMDVPIYKRRALLYSFHVMEAFQGLGIGTALLREAETHLKEFRFGFATLAVAKNNHKARRLYEKRGYRIVGDDTGEWTYTDHRGVLRKINEPSYLLEKSLL
jgi:ribosomal protein S18 acetylase RimI-like enzyme